MSGLRHGRRLTARWEHPGGRRPAPGAGGTA